MLHLLHTRSLYAYTLLPCLSPYGEQTREHVVRSMNGSSAATAWQNFIAHDKAATSDLSIERPVEARSPAIAPITTVATVATIAASPIVNRI